MLSRFSNWLQKLFVGSRWPSPGSAARATGGQGRFARERTGKARSGGRTRLRPLLEGLEERTLPSGFCATPGKDGTPGAPLAGIINTYYAGTANVAAGATTINLGAPRGAATAIGDGDLLLVVQVQNATINSSNTSTYGDGSGSGAGSLTTTAGTYEYVEAKGAVGGGGALTIAGTGVGGGLLNSYFEAASTATHGQETFEVVRVPQYVNASLGSTLTAAAWNGSTGGILAVDVAGNLNLNAATVSVDGEGFRGGAGRQLGGDASASNTDYVNLSTKNVHGSKGEGTAGTPEWVYDRTTDTNINTGQANDGYPGGSTAHGAPGNAGGGGTEADPVNNDQNTGGGGGGNGGQGGQGGYSWATALNTGGLGGAVFPASVGSLVLGGGGGAGVRNNSSGTASAGGTGGGIVLLRAGSVSGTGTVTANGVMGVTPQNDGGPGGGAGGDVEVLIGSGALTGLSIQARGARGTDAFPAAVPGGSTPPSAGSNFHGPGGGGGGGVVILSGPAGAIDVTGGGHGTTTTAQDIYGAVPGNPGIILIPAAAESQVPGVHAGFECIADVAVATSAPAAVLPNGTITYTITVHNGGPADAQTVSLTDAVPAGTTFVSATQTGGASAFTLTKPPVGGTGTLTGTDGTLVAGDTATFLVTVQLNAGVTTGATVTDTANVAAATLDPYQANNSSTAQTTVGPDADLAVTNSAPATVALGGTLTYTIAVSNNGPSAALNVALSDLLPAGMTFVSQTQTSGPAFALGNVGNQLNDTIATLASGQSSTFQVQATVTAAAGTVLSDTAQVSSPTLDPNAANNSAVATTTVKPTADLAVTVTAPANVTAGNTLTYTVTVKNNGPSDAQTVALSDLLPAGTAFVSQTQTGGPAFTLANVGNRLNDTIATLANGQTATLQVVVRVLPSVANGTNLSDTATASAATPDTVPGNNSQTATTAVATSADLATVKFAPAQVAPGANFTYLFTVYNLGPSDAQNVTVTDVLPGAVTYVSQAQAGGPAATLTHVGNSITDTIVTLPGGQSATFQVVVSVAAGTAQGTAIPNVVNATSGTADPNPNNNIGPVQSFVGPSPGLAISKVVSNPTPNVGNTITYTTTLTNVGAATATGITVSDPLPAGLAGVVATPAAGTTYAAGVWSIASLAPNATVTLTFTGTVNDPNPHGSTATVTGSSKPFANPDLASATETPQLADLGLTNVVSNPTPNVGDVITYTVTLTNAGPNTATNVTVGDALPAGLTGVTTAGSAGTSYVGGVWTIPSLASGGSVTLTFSGTVADAATHTSTATVTAEDQFDPTTPDTAAATETAQQAELTLTNVVSNPMPNTGDVITYTVTLTNAGPNAATNVTVGDALPAGLTGVTTASGAGTGYANGVWTVPNLPSGGSVTLTFTGTVANAQSHTSTATVTHSDQFDPTTPDTASATETPTADLTLTNVVSNAAPYTGHTITYTVTLTNAGPDTATNVTVGDAVPAWLTGVTTTTAAGTSYAGGVWTVPSLASGGSVTLTFSGAVADAATHTSTATVNASDQFDPTTPDTAAATETSQTDVILGNNQTLSTNENTALPGTVTATANDSDPLTYAVATGPTHGALALAANGTFTYTPNASYHGADSFTFTANDGPNTSAQATVSITVVDNSVPVGNPQAVSTNENTALPVVLTATDSDGDPLTYAIATAPTHGTLTPTGNGAYTYTPNANYHGPDAFNFTANDGTNTSAPATVSINVVDNSVPVGNPQSVTTNENTALPVTVTATDSDGDLLTYAVATAPTHGALVRTANGAYTYTPANNYHGPDAFTFTANDGTNTSAPATVSITVVDNSVPVGNPQAVSTNENTALPVVLMATDSDGDPLTYAVATGPTHGTLTPTGNGAYTYTPANNYHGPDAFTFTANDGTNTSAPATVSITVVDNSVPVGNPQVVSTNENTALPVVLTATDSDGDPLTYAVATGPTHGTLTPTGNGAYTYTPANNYHGPDAFTFTANDGTNTSAPATVSITVVDNSVPVGNPQAVSTNENTALPVVLTATDSDGDPLTYAVATAPTHGTLTKTANGAYTYTPANNYHGPDAFTFTANDGTNTSAPATVSITVVDNSVPVGNPQSVSTNENTALPVTLTATDSDGDPLTYAVATAPTHGTLTPTGNGAYTYTPANGYFGPDTFTFTANDGTNTSSPATVSIRVDAPPTTANNTVNTQAGTPRNFAPADFPFSDPDVGDRLQSVRIASLPAQGTLALNGIPVSPGQVIPVGQLTLLTYTPPANQVGAVQDTFNFAVSDGTAFSATAVMTVNVAAPVPPAINPIADVYMNNCTSFPFTYGGSFADAANGGPFSGFVNYGDGSGLQALAVNANQTFTLAHVYSHRGVFEVDLAITDGRNLTGTSSFFVGAHLSLPQAYGQLFTLNDGSVQRSMVTSITLSFGQHETLDAGAVTVTTQAGQSVGFRTVTRDINGQTVVFVQFTDPTLIAGSLADGRYQISVNGSKVHNQQGAAYNGGAVAVDSFFRLFGDSNGDAKVDSTDLAAFRAALRSLDGTTPYRWYFDYDLNCTIDAADYSAFLNRYGRSV